ncbi:MAG: phosphatidate cytidylyltransferase [Elusimicrobiota bacterium]
MILPRIITAIIGIPLVMLAVFWGGIPFFVMMIGVTFLALREYFMLARISRYDTYPLAGTIAGLLLFISIFLNNTYLADLDSSQGTSLIVTVILIFLFLVEMLRKSPERAVERLSVTFFGAFFIPWALAHMFLIRNLPGGGANYLYFIFLLIWVLDTGAYAFGVRFGKRKLASSLSPRKTVEGAVGGIVTGALGAIILRFFFLSTQMTVSESVVLGILVAVIAQFSDLAESVLKRDAGVKDSSALLPGHGGMLDRFDSFLFAAPLFYYYLTVFKAG